MVITPRSLSFNQIRTQKIVKIFQILLLWKEENKKTWKCLVVALFKWLQDHNNKDMYFLNLMNVIRFEEDAWDDVQIAL